MAYPVTLNGRTYTLADFEGTNYVNGFPDALEDFVTQAGNIYTTTSTSSVAIGTGSKTFTVADSGKPYIVGTPLRIADSAAPSTNWIDGIVTSYSGTTLVVDAVAYAGSGAIASWNINIGGSAIAYTGTLPIAQGGTGATTAAAAATNLGLGTGDSPTFAGATITGDLTVDTNTLHVDSTNNRVGIGTASPSAPLDVVGSPGTLAEFRDGVAANFIVETSSNVTTIGNQAGSSILAFKSSNSEAMRITSDGRVGIGTSVPASELHIETATSASLRIISSTTGANTIYLGDTASGTAGYIQYNNNNDYMRFAAGGAERLRITSDGSVAIGTNNPASIVGGSDSNPILTIAGAESVNVPTGDKVGSLSFKSGDTSWTAVYADGVSGEIASVSESGTGAAYGLAFYTGTITGSDRGERVRIDRSGNLLVAQSASASPGVTNTITGHSLSNVGYAAHSRDAGVALHLNRNTSDGDIAEFRKNGVTVGNIVAYSGSISIVGNNYGIFFNSNIIAPVNSTGLVRVDNLMDIGQSAYRFDDIYATNGTIQTSDANEKQDVEELNEAERRVAVAAKGLIRKYRWIDAVQEKGDDARIHVGIIAQDLKAAFEAEGLDPGRYAMFISSTWWEKERVIPAVEAQDAVYEDFVIPAVLDDEGNEIEPETTETRLISEAVEGRAEQTVIDMFETAEEAPEGATERTRLGVRYPELLAFIISAL